MTAKAQSVQGEDIKLSDEPHAEHPIKDKTSTDRAPESIKTTDSNAPVPTQQVDFKNDSTATVRRSTRVKQFPTRYKDFHCEGEME